MTRFTTAVAIAALTLATFAAAPISVQAAQVMSLDKSTISILSSGLGKGGSSSYSDNCGEELGFMPRVLPADIAGVTSERKIWVTEICPTSDLSSDHGNARMLRSVIAENEVIVEALGRRAFVADDVMGVKMMRNGTVSLLVHRH